MSKITLEIEDRDGLTIITSPHVRGLYIMESDRQQAMAQVFPVIDKLAELNAAKQPTSGGEP